MRLIKQVSNSLLCALIVFQMGVGIPVYASGMQIAPKSSSAPAQENVSADYPKKLVDAYGEVLDAENPLLMDFVKGPALPNEFKFQIPQSDAAVDQDPFFLRSQSWQPNSQPIDGGFSYQKTAQGIEIAFSSWTQKLIIKADLTPIVESDDYLFLSASVGSDIFSSRSPELKGADDTGLFFISKKDLIAQGRVISEMGPMGTITQGVPVFYIPLPGNEWAGKLRTFEWLSTNDVVFYSSKNMPMPISLNDVAALEKVSRSNMLKAQMVALYNSSRERMQNSDIQSAVMMPLPEAGVTAGFGLFLTGKIPDLTLFAKQENPIIKKLMQALQAVVGSPAHADWGNFTSLLTPDLWQRINILNAILGGAAVYSIIIKHWTYRDEFIKRYGHAKNPKQWAWNEIRGFFDVYSHTLLAVHMGLGLTITTSFEYLLDRFATKFSGPKTGMIRRIFNYTWGWTRDVSSKLAMNAKTFFLGAIVMGGVDAGLVVVQLLFAVPWILTYMGFQAHNNANAQYVTSEIIRNFYSYFKTGAFSYSEEQKFLVQDEARSIADSQLRQRGLDPLAKENHTIRENLVENILNDRMKQMGLPDKDQFLFDHNTIMEKIASANGFQVKGAPDENEEHGKYILDKGRWGIAGHALELALKNAEKIQSEAPSVTGANTVKLLKWAVKRNGFMKSAWNNVKDSILGKFKSAADRAKALARSPKDYLERQISEEFVPKSYKSFAAQTRDIRKAMTLMSYTGDIKPLLKVMPEAWREASGSPEAAEMAGKLYNSAFFSIIEGEPDRIYPSVEIQKKFKDTAMYDVDAAEATTPEIKDPFVKRVYTLETVRELYTQEKVQKELESYNPDSPSYDRSKSGISGWVAKTKAKIKYGFSFYERIQINRAQKVAAQAMLDGKDAKWAYTKAMGRQTGLYLEDPEDSEFVRLVLERAKEKADAQMKLPNEQQYMSTLFPEQQRLYEARVYGQHFLESYSEMSLLTDEFLAHDSPEQPGWLQWSRKKVYGIKYLSGVYTPLARVVESVFASSPNPYRPGFLAKFQRNVPFIYSMARNMKMSYGHQFLPYATFSFLTANYAWQLNIDYPIWILAFASGFFATTMVQWNNQMNRNLGWKPMSSTWSKVKYAFVHSWLTFGTFIPTMMYAQPFSNWWTRNIEAPAYALLRPLANGTENLIGACARFLGM